MELDSRKSRRNKIMRLKSFETKEVKERLAGRKQESREAFPLMDGNNRTCLPDERN